MLRRIFYVSVMAKGTTETDIQSIVSSSTIWNRRHDITGMLVATAQNFAQALEGRDADIDLVMARILADRRHSDLRIQINGRESKRRFGSWSMAYVARRDLGDELQRLHDTPRSAEERASTFEVLARACLDVTPDL